MTGSLLDRPKVAAASLLASDIIDRLDRSMADGLEAERKVVRLQRALDVSTGMTREAYARLDRLVAGLSSELRSHQATRRELDEVRRAYQELQDAVQLHAKRAREAVTTAEKGSGDGER